MSETSKAVFLSYASQDADAAKKICEALRAAGVEVWFDQSELVGGDAWDQKIRKQIRECALLIPIISENTQSRTEGYFRLEWRLADQRTHLMAKGRPFLLPVVVDGTRDAEAQVPDSFMEVQWTLLRSLSSGGQARQGDDPALAKFSARVKKLLGSQPVGGALRPDTVESSGHKAPPTKSQLPWLKPVIGAAVVAVLALVISRPWEKKAPPPAAPTAPIAPVSEVRQLTERAQALVNKPGAARAELEAAEELCRKAAKLDPTDGDVLSTWSQVCTWLVFHGFDASPERKEAARSKAAQALQLAPGSYEARFAQACYLVRGGGVAAIVSEGDQADELLHALLRENPDEPRALLALGVRQGRIRHIAEARTTLGRLAANPAFAATAWGELGWLEMFAANHPAAEADADRANELQPLWRNLILKTLLAVEWRGDLDLALATEGRLPESVQQEDVGVFTATYLGYLRHEPEQMLRLLDATPRPWIDSGGYIGPTAVWAALAHEQLGAKDRAEAEWRLALKSIERRLDEAPDRNLQLLAAYVLAALDRKADAEKMLGLVRDASVPEPLPWLRRNRYVLTQLRLGHTDAALDFLEGDPRLTAAVLRIESPFDSLRTLPRFQALQARLEGDPRRSPTARPAAAASASSLAVDQKSVAVLAFANLSDDKNNEYFSDGISEELLNVLAKIPGLKVAARTSAFYFKGKEVPIPEIARQLGVAYVVEGSVRKAGDKVRITAQLIKAADGFHVWSDTFTRDMKDIFAVQDEIAGLIAKNLELKMGVVAARPVVDLEAYQEYLTGRAAAAKAGNVDLQEAVRHFEKAVAIEPKFTAAWVQLASAHTQLGRWGGAPTLQAWKAARAAIDRALAIEPDSPEVLLALGWIQRTGEWDWRGAEQSIRRSLKLRPNQPDALAGLAVLLFNVGKREEAFRLGKQAAQLDPLNPATQIDLSLMFYFSDDNVAEAERSARRALQLAPGGAGFHSVLGWSLVAQRRYAEAEAEALLDTDEIQQAAVLGVLAVARGQKEAARAQVARLDEIARTSGDLADLQQTIAWICAGLGDKERAFAALEKARASRDPSMSWLRSAPYLAPLYSDPRWPELLRKVGLADDQLK